MKKLKYFLLILIILLTCTIFVYPDTGSDIDILCDIGLLPPSTVSYAKNEINRLSAAKSILWLSGKYDEAKNGKWSNNYSDANLIESEEDIRIMAYSRATKLLGDDFDGKFLPFGKINSKDYYNAVFRALGYPYIKDAGYTEVYDFAKSLGFDIINKPKLTWEDVASIMMQSLKARTKDGQRLGNRLVGKKKLEKEKAESLGIYVEMPPAPSSLTPIGNTRLEMRFSENVSPLALTDKLNYWTEDIEINQISIINPKLVHLETSPQVKGKTYKMNLGQHEMSFVGKERIMAIPYVTSVNSPDDETLEINFSRDMDYKGVVDIRNYNIPNLEIESLKYEYNSLILKVSKLLPNKTYNIMMKNLKSVDKINMVDDRTVFTNKVDLIPPKLEKVEAETIMRVCLYFDETLDLSSAQNTANYKVSIKNIDLKITKAEVFGSKKDGVKLTLSNPLSLGNNYTLTINDISDKAKNKIKRPIIKNFYGVAEDKEGPRILKKDTEIVSKDEIRVVFTDKSDIDEKSALDIKNYNLLEGNRLKSPMTIYKSKKESYKDGILKVLLTVDTLNPKDIYELIVKNVTDEFGNVIKNDNNIVFRMKYDLARPARISKHNIVNNNKIELFFDKNMDKEQAIMPDNYFMSKDIGYPSSVGFSNKKITLSFEEALEELVSYKLEISNLSDMAGNEINLALTIKGKEEPPEVLYFTQDDEKSFELYMSEEVRITSNQVYMGGDSFRISLDKDNKDTVYLKTSKIIDEEREYSLDLAEHLVDLKGIKAKNTSSKITVLQEKWGEYVDREKPFIDKVLFIDSNIVEIIYNENLSYAGTYDISYFDEEDKEDKTLDIKSCEIKGYQVIIKLDEETPMEEGIDYKLIIKKQAKDLANNISENELGEEFDLER